MNRINWKLRLKNKTTLLALITCGCTFVFQVLGILGIAASVSEDMVMQLVGLALNFLVALGIVVDPTTRGVVDSDSAITYEKPR